ncbi:MAG: DUF3237 domain-containing protein, partial [Deltaproteobacteria bacterium]
MAPRVGDFGKAVTEHDGGSLALLGDRHPDAVRPDRAGPGGGQGGFLARMRALWQGAGMALELIPFATATATLAPPIMLPNTPAGTRVIFEIVDYRWEGPRFTARQKGSAAADWLLLGPDGTGTLDVRVTLETADGAVVLVHYGGRVDGSKGLGGEAPVYAAVQFETG